MNRDPTELSPDVIGSQVDLLLNPKRSRDWEGEQRKRRIVATYRGIPPELQDRIKHIAKTHQVNIGDVARRFLEYAAAAYEAGDLELESVVLSTKRTLFPDDD